MPNEKRGVFFYDQFAGDNFCLKFIDKFKRKKKCFFYLYLLQNLQYETRVSR